MTALPYGRDPTEPEIELLDAEVFEAPRRLGLWDLRDQTGIRPGLRPFNEPDLEDDR